ncbi:CehA/McbA family metallohydrolase [Gimibacter soli]|uniref:CehA/McbA family metallohydrolase n=1 Tax=Gimibacter soli TaxID=3024400 RepID=A0AAE9XR72_9PROT|nr:CehA/McbA family metallohydrolase [Gimibacter soli]WCL54679.1 CehA/McbA family metallohydrolase [Gimibacter soli]
MTMRTKRFQQILMIGAGLMMMTPATVAQDGAKRQPVLQSLTLPHSYYWREMYLPQLTAGPSSVAFTPDGKALVYSMGGSLWRQDLDSEEAVELTHGPGYDYQPDVSPDGRYVYFVRHSEDSLQLMRLDMEQGLEARLSDGRDSYLEPRVSPDGRRLAFVSTRGTGQFNLFVANVDENGLTGVRTAVMPRQSAIDRYYYAVEDHAINPSWSPDGERLLFVANREIAWGSGDVWSVSSRDPADIRKVVSEETTWAARPEISPDGKRVLYASYEGRQWHQLWLTNRQGQSPMPLTFGDFDRKNARWSPDGKQVAFISNETGGLTLWVLDMVGGAMRQITATSRVPRVTMRPLAVHLADEAGQPLPARVSVLGADGRYYGPVDARMHGDDAFVAAKQSQETRYFHCPGVCRLMVPEGAVTVHAQHGFARTPADVTVEAGEKPAEARLTLVANGLPSTFGTHVSADLHVHMNYGGAYKQTVETMAAEAKAEDLDVIYNLIVNKEQRIPNVEDFHTGADRVNGVTVYWGQEYHTSFWGHQGLLHLDDHLLLPDFASYRHTGLASPYPHGGTIADLAHAQNALVGYVHPFDWIPDPEAPAALSHMLPADVANGRADYLEVVGFSDHLATAEVWYKFLNLGYKLAAGAGTDAMTNYASLRGPVGLNRVFLRAENTEPETLKAALKAGHGFVTNGPLVGLRAGDVRPGDTLTMAAPGKVAVELALRSPVPVNRAELVFNGEVIQTLQLSDEGRAGHFLGEIELPGSGWLVLRAVGDADSIVQDIYPYATTNPVWVEVKDMPAPEANADAAYLKRWMDRVIEAATARKADFNTEEEFRATLDYLEAARAAYEARM